MKTIYLEPKQVPAQLRAGYTGNKFTARVETEWTIPATAGMWDGGSREEYFGLDLATGERLPLSFGNAAPWNGARRETTVQLVPGKAIVRRIISQGRDLGMDFFIHPDNAAALLPAPVADLSVHERVVLKATKCFKSSYGGRDRYQMAMDDSDYRRMLDGAAYPTREEWNAAKASLIGRGLLNKAGAITVAGRNAAK